MSNSKNPFPEGFLELKKLGKLYLALVVVGWLFFLMQKVHTPVNIPIDNTLIDSAKFAFQSIIGNQQTKQVCMLFVLLYTAFVAMETLVLLRLYAAWLYSKFKQNKAVD